MGVRVGTGNRYSATDRRIRLSLMRLRRAESVAARRYSTPGASPTIRHPGDAAEKLPAIARITAPRHGPVGPLPAPPFSGMIAPSFSSHASHRHAQPLLDGSQPALLAPPARAQSPSPRAL